jgi:DNA uptake protein ComE-like DNA-binding protein
MRILFAFFLLALSAHGTEFAAAEAQDVQRALAIPAPEERIDINHASLEQLTKVPGMTRTWAARIVRFRPYRTKVDLVDKGVLSPEVYERIKDYVIAHREKAE